MRIIYFILVALFIGSTAFSDEKINLEQAIKDLSSENYDTRLKAKKLIESAGLRAIPVLRKAMKSEDLETKEFAEKKVSERISYQKEDYKIENILGSESNVISADKYLMDYYDYLKNYLLKAYDKNSAKDPKWNALVKKMIPIWVESHYLTEKDNEFVDIYHTDKGHRKLEMELRKMINELTELNCDDALFIFFRLSLYYAWSDHRFSMYDLTKATDALIKANYSYYFKYYSSIRAKALKSKTMGNKNKEVVVLSQDVLNDWIELGKEEFVKSKIGQRRYVLWFTNFVESLSITDLEEKMEKISENIGKDTWADHLIKANFHMKKAWFHRGSGYANDVNEEGWKLFRSNLVEVSNHAKAAAILIPEYPEPNVQMIKVCMAESGDSRIRLWFEKAVKAELNNTRAYYEYIWALYPRWGGSSEEMLSFGREYLIINHPKINTAKFYMLALKSVRGEGGVVNTPAIIDEMEWAIEQQMAFKPVYGSLLYNDLAIAAFENQDFDKSLKAIRETKGLFSTGWGTSKYNSSYIERFVTFIEKYKTKKTGIALSSLVSIGLENDIEKLKVILDNLKTEIEPIDQPKIVNILMNIKPAELMGAEDELMDLQYNYGYREETLIDYMNLSQGAITEKLKTKMLERFGAKTMEALDVTIKFTPTGSDSRKEITEKIKAIFMKELQNEKELDTNDEYHKSLIRAIVYLGKSKNENQNYKNIFMPLVKKIQNLGDGGQFLSAQVLATENTNLASGLGDCIKSFFYNHNDQNLAAIEQEIFGLSAIGNDKLWEEIKKIWFAKGRPVLVIEMINLLRERKLDVEAEILRTWLFYCMEAYNATVKDEALIQTLGICPGYHKEAFQMGIRSARAGTCNVMNYLVAYHAFKLGHYHFAYEYIVKAQTMKDHGDAVTLNKKRFAKSAELLQYIVEEMLASKDLPEYIRFNLKDQFDVKFKK